MVYNPELPICLLDCDGVVVDFLGGALRCATKVTGIKYDRDEVTTYGIEDCLKLTPEQRDAMIAMWRRPGFCIGLAPYPEAIEGVRALREVANVYPVTAPFNSTTWVAERDQWLHDHFGFDRMHVVHTEQKWLVRGDMLVDDKVGDHDALVPGATPKRKPGLRTWAEHHPHGHAVLWKQLYNATVSFDGHHTNDWNGVYELLRAMRR